jgi:hypothetical protein
MNSRPSPVRLAGSLAFAYLASFSLSVFGASHRTQNFIISAGTSELAREVAEAAERYRRDVAIDWLGAELQPWRDPCRVSVVVESGRDSQGETSYVFERGRPTSWQMYVQGTHRAVLRSVLPHEITHAVFATRFGRPLPRWAEEGACVTVEHRRDRSGLENMLPARLTVGKVMGLSEMFALRQYPRDALPLYAQGYSLVRFLLSQGGKPKFIGFLESGLDNADWTAATRTCYGYKTLDELQTAWTKWALLDHSSSSLALGKSP